MTILYDYYNIMWRLWNRSTSWIFFGPTFIYASSSGVSRFIVIIMNIKFYPKLRCSTTISNSTSLRTRIWDRLSIFGLQNHPNKLYYLVDWLGYMPNDRTWKPAKNVDNVLELIQEFHLHYQILVHALRLVELVIKGGYDVTNYQCQD